MEQFSSALKDFAQRELPDMVHSTGLQGGGMYLSGFSSSQPAIPAQLPSLQQQQAMQAPSPASLGLPAANPGLQQQQFQLGQNLYSYLGADEGAATVRPPRLMHADRTCSAYL